MQFYLKLHDNFFMKTDVAHETRGKGSDLSYLWMKYVILLLPFTLTPSFLNLSCLLVYFAVLYVADEGAEREKRV